MPFTQPWLEVDFGSAYGGLGTVGYRLYKSDGTDSVARTTTGVIEISTNSGKYGKPNISIPDDAVGVQWDTGGGSPVYATEDLEPYRDRDAILTDTDAIDTRLPSDPADQSLVEAAITAAEGNVRGADSEDLTTLKDRLGFHLGAVWCSVTGNDANPGTATEPVLTFAQALTVAAAQKLRRIRLVGGITATLAASLDDFEIFGDDLTTINQVDLNGKNVSGVTFHRVTVTGNNGNSVGVIGGVQSSFVAPMANLYGVLDGCIFLSFVGSQFDLTPGQFGSFSHCAAMLPPVTGAISAVKFGLSGSTLGAEFAGWSGPMILDGMDDAGSVVNVECSVGSVEVLNTCTAGTINIRGDCDITNNSGPGCTVNDYTSARESNVEGHATDALNTYDPPTRAEATTDKNAVLAAVAPKAIEANVEGHVASALSTYDPPTKAEMDAAFSALTELSKIGNALGKDNVVWEDIQKNHTYGDIDYLTDATGYAYDSQTNATAHDKSTGLLYTFTYKADFTDADMNWWRITRAP